MKIDSIQPYSYQQSFKAGKIKVFSDFDKTFLPVSHMRFVLEAQRKNSKGLKDIFKSFAEFLTKTKKSLSFTITTGRTFGEYAEMAELSREGKLGMPLPDALITKNGGDVHIKVGTDDAFYNGGEFPFKYDVTDKKKENYIKEHYQWDGDAIKKTFKDEYEAKGLRIVEADSEHSADDHGERSLFSSGKLSKYKHGDEWSAGFRNDGKLKFFVLGPNDDSGKKADVIKQMDEKIKAELEKKGIKYLPANYEVKIRGRQGADLGPNIDGEPLTKAYDTKLAVKEAIANNDLVITAGDSSNDIDMINPVTYLIDNISKQIISPQQLDYLKKNKDNPEKIIEFLDENPLVASEYLKLPYCGIISVFDNEDLLNKLKSFTQGKYQKLVIAEKGKLEDGIKDAIALHCKQYPKYKEILDSEIKSQIVEATERLNKPKVEITKTKTKETVKVKKSPNNSGEPKKPDGEITKKPNDDDGGDNKGFWKYILGEIAAIAAIIGIYKVAKNKKDK